MRRRKMKYKYYENGKEEILSERDLHYIYNNIVDGEQKKNGTTFLDWKEEMLHYNILN